MTIPLYEAYVAADKAYYAAHDRLQEETDPALLGQLQAAYDQALERVDAAKQALIDSDDPRPWNFSDDEGGHFLTTSLRPSEVEARLREAITRDNYNNGAELNETIWVGGHARCDDTGERFTVDYTIDPEPPSCSEAEHDWQSPAFLGGCAENPGIFGNAGGVIIHECCMHCGCERVTNTWAQNPQNGTQGHTTVAYDEGKYAEQLEQAADAGSAAAP